MEIHGTHIKYALIAVVCALSAELNGAMFEIIEGLNFIAVPGGLSDDGRVVVGTARDGTSQRPARWTRDLGVQTLEEISNTSILGKALGVSADGSVIVGETNTGAFRWTEERGLEELGRLAPNTPLITSAFAVSSDGSIVAGTGLKSLSTPEAFRWTEEDGLVELNNDSILELPRSRALAMTPDGDKIVGGFFARSFRQSATIWSGSSRTRLGSPTFEATDISADGLVVIGTTTSNQAFRWTEDVGVEEIGPSDSDISGVPNGVSGNGSVIVGNLSFPRSAFIWDEEHGMQDLMTVLEEIPGIDLGSFRITEALDISEDGRTIMGLGVGDIPWIATLDPIPEPGSFVILILGIPFIFRCRPGQRV